jgi:rhamnulokinase
VAQAALFTDTVSIVDVQDARFLPPSNEHSDMPGRIAAWCAEHDVPAPQGKPATVRCIIESIAVAIARALEQASSLADRPIGVVHVVGGGAQNSLLCQAIANRSGLRVLAGPVEATAIGNVLVQARSAGLLGPDLADLRALVAASHQLAQYVPQA